ncbi:MAG: hypothetical protein QOG04_984 [Actinomycetota bacterium]|jgi:SAM-dependent methyltransferase|nr:hypothetical protein [Actinomycetota bacterium]
MTSLDKKGVEYLEGSNDFRDHRFWQWHSVWYQAKVPIELEDVHTVLEFGPGRGLAKTLMEHFGIDHTSVDLPGGLSKPDYISTLKDFHSENTFDLVCAFEVLEHNPRGSLEEYLAKMARLSNRYVYVSIPFSGRWSTVAVSVSLPHVGIRKIWTRAVPRRWRHIPRDTRTYASDPNPYRFHWWEGGDPGSKRGDLARTATQAGLKVTREWHNPMFPFHWFLLMERF